MSSIFDALHESVPSSDNITWEGLHRTVQFGAAASYKDQMSVLRKDDALKDSTFHLLLADAHDYSDCMPTDSEDSYEKLKVCIETQTLRKALRNKEPQEVKRACDEINSNRDARAVHDLLTSTEKQQVQLKGDLDKLGQKIEILVPDPQRSRRN